MLGIHVERGPEHETAGEMYRRLKRERKEGLDRSHPFKDMCRGAFQGAMTSLMYGQTTKAYAEERESIRSDVEARAKGMTQAEIERKTDATMSSRLGVARMMMMSPAGRPLPDTSHIHDPAGMEHGGRGL